MYRESEDFVEGSYREQYKQPRYIIPEVLKNFLTYFQKSIHEQNIYEIQNAYENGFNKLTDRFFKNSPWPDSDSVSLVVNNAAESPVPLELPNQWLWDIIDEFIYQFQSFSQYRCKLSKKTDEEIEALQANPKVWNVHSVLNVLHSLVDKSNINNQLEVYTSGGDPNSVAGEFGRHSLYKMLGYFSLVGLLRLHSLLGDYYQALKVLENVDFNKKVARCKGRQFVIRVH
ncbi:hypothetical protein LSH36_269g04005 [Paralvinella palmiformis]|uniref:Eukaryotic translation initiation factor 3 subunit L n=1 Tax=Paralvinella palmiformis TaxID=53620 RepID=A0AAD9JJX0_9ANNE|nr:hypothetical protein LSH36_269g04005 [Paralvinella palmiformis]